VRDFQYFEPVSISEAVFLLANKEKAKVIAGGTDLIPQLQSKAIRPEYVVNIGRIPLCYIKSDDTEGVKIGALTTIRAVEKSVELQERYGILCEAACQMASISVRNIATIGGNLCNASPGADMAPPLIGLSATARIVGPGGERIVPLEHFFSGSNTTVLKADELLVEIQAPPLAPHSGAVFLKFGKLGAVEVAIVSVAVVITLESTAGVCREAKVVLGSAAPTPMRALRAEKILEGKRIDDKVIEEAAQAASMEARPRTGLRGPAQYKRDMVKVFTRRAVRAALELAKRR